MKPRYLFAAFVTILAVLIAGHAVAASGLTDDQKKQVLGYMIAKSSLKYPDGSATDETPERLLKDARTTLAFKFEAKEVDGKPIGIVVGPIEKGTRTLYAQSAIVKGDGAIDHVQFPKCTVKIEELDVKGDDGANPQPVCGSIEERLPATTEPADANGFSVATTKKIALTSYLKVTIDLDTPIDESNGKPVIAVHVR